MRRDRNPFPRNLDHTQRSEAAAKPVPAALFSLFAVISICLLISIGTAHASRSTGDTPDKPVYLNDEQLALLEKARSAWEARNLPGVIDILTDFISIPFLENEIKAAAYLDRGNAYLKMGEPGLAIADLDISLELATAEPERAYVLRGMAFELQGARQQAAWSYVQALKSAPTNEAINRHVMRFFTNQ